MNKSISIFMPALNEEKNIGKSIEEIENYAKQKKLDYEIIIVNDASTDNTAGVVKKYSKQNPRVILVNKNLPHGYGSALKKGFFASSKDLIFFMDSDLQFNISDLDKFLTDINSYDYIIGYRERRSDPYIRSVNAKCYAFLVRILLGVKVKDIDCAFKLFKADVIHSIDIKSDGALINAEILYKLRRKGYKFEEIPVLHFPRKFGNPTGANIFVILKMFKELFMLKLNLLR